MPSKPGLLSRSADLGESGLPVLSEANGPEYNRRVEGSALIGSIGAKTWNVFTNCSIVSGYGTKSASKTQTYLARPSVFSRAFCKAPPLKPARLVRCSSLTIGDPCLLKTKNSIPSSADERRLKPICADSLKSVLI